MRSRSMPVLFCALFATVALVLMPAAASAQLAPPGNSAIDQYRESIPEVTGDRVSGDTDERTPEQVLGEKNAEALRELAPDGGEAAEMVVRGAPTSGVDREQRVKIAKDRAGDSNSGPVKLASLATGLSGTEGGLGPLLPLLILTAIVLFTGIAIGKWRRAGPGE